MSAYRNLPSTFILKRFSSTEESNRIPTYELGEMFEGDFANMCVKNFHYCLCGHEQNGRAWADPEGNAPIGDSEN